MTYFADSRHQMFAGRPPSWTLIRPKPVAQHVWDLIGAPLRMAVLPDHVSERLHLTSLRSERLAMVLPELSGRCLDIGAGDNMLLQIYREQQVGTREAELAQQSVGLDVVDWGGECTIVPDCRDLPFPDSSFDTVSFVACLNHIPEREDAVSEAYRVLRSGGRVVVTMIGPLPGQLGHRIWWYSEDKHRKVMAGELPGMSRHEVEGLLSRAGFTDVSSTSFVYRLNHLFVARKKS